MPVKGFLFLIAPLDFPRGLMGAGKRKDEMGGSSSDTPEQPAAIAALITDFQLREQHLGTYN